MPKRIQEDHKKFRDVISGKSREELKRMIKSGAIVRNKPRGGRVTISIPRIDIPHFVFGDTGEGIGRGPGKEGDVVGRDPQPGKGTKAGEGEGDGIRISIDMEDLFKIMEEDLKLPRMKPKPSQTFDEIKIKYTNISKVGLNSLRHIRRTMKEAIKRTSASGDKANMVMVPGSMIPVKIITPIKSDFRYRQYKETKIPSSHAVIFFARDCSGSMDDYRCEIVSDMSWWIDCWIKRFYKKVDHRYFVHDSRAVEVSEDEFYSLRLGGGTTCSTAFDAISQQLENQYHPEKYNIYVFYFTDGENSGGDNARLIEIIKDKLGPNITNLIGITQVCSSYSHSVKEDIDKAIGNDDLKVDHVKTVSVGDNSRSPVSAFGRSHMSEEDRNQQIIEGIRNLLTSKETHAY